MEDECVAELGRPITGLKVAELRDELTKRALVRTGNKKELIDRLRTAIQREAQLNAANQSNLQSVQQQQQQMQQNVAPYMNPGVAMQTEHAAAAYQQQLSQIQAQTHLGSYAISPQQQYQQQPTNVMQPLDLQQPQQQQINDYQQLEQQKQSSDRQQQYQADANQPPPIDMRVPQQQSQESPAPEIQSIDLSSSARQMSPVNPATNETVLAEQDITRDTKTPGVSAKDEGVEHNAQVSEETLIKEPHNSDEKQCYDNKMIETKSQEEEMPTTITEQTTKSIIDGESKQSQVEERSSTISDKLDKKESEAEATHSSEESILTQESELKVSSNDATIADSQTLSTISLKRHASNHRLSSDVTTTKEKRRKWSSSVNSDEGQNTSRASVITGGISSQRLQDLIEEKQAEANLERKPGLQEQENAEESVAKSAKIYDDVSDRDENLHNSKCNDGVEQEKSVEGNVSASKAQGDDNASQTIESECEPTNVLLVQNLVRPFTLLQLKDVLTKHGPIMEDKFWTDKVKSKCCAMYESIDVAKMTRDELNGQQWPSSNPKTLKISYITEEALIRYQNSDNKVDSSSTAIDLAENGDTLTDQGTKSIANRLGERVDDNDASGDTVKKRLGEKVSLEISTMSSNVNRDGGNSNSQELDDLFKKTKAIPHIFWLPMTEEEADVREKEREERISRREAARKNRETSLIRRRSPPVRHRSPFERRSPTRRRSPPRHRSPISRRSPPRRRLSPRHRSPLLRRSSPRRRSPRPSPPPRRRSPSLTSPSHRRRPPSISPSPPRRRSPGLLRRSPGLNRRSPMERSPGFGGRRSPGLVRRSPGIVRRSPGLVRRSPGMIRRSPGMIRRSPAPVRGSSPRRSPLLRKRSPLRRRSPPRNISPGPLDAGYPADQRRIQRMDRHR